MAIGMGLVMAPATESIMGSLPRAKAGVGSAMNDTTRQVGGALGVAVVGSVMLSVYSGRVGDAITNAHLPVSANRASQARQKSRHRASRSRRDPHRAGRCLGETRHPDQ